MENLIFLVSESWSTVAADQFFSILQVGTASPSSLDFGGGRTSSGLFFGMFWDMFRFLAATAFVAILAYYVTKKMAGANVVGRKSNNLSVVESINLGGHAVVKLVKVGEKYLVLGVTKERVTMLSEVDKEQITELEAQKITVLDTPFGKVLSRFIKPQETQGNDDEDE
jgi:flagellar protein FliO/FliZ